MISARAVRRLNPEGFVGATLVLVGGTASAHVITASMMPILSRLYAPSEIGLLAVFVGLLTTAAVAAGLRFDVAVALPEGGRDAQGLLILSVLSAAAVSVILLAIVLVAPREVARLVGQPRLGQYLWLVPVGIFLAAVQSALQSWNIRRRNFSLLAHARIAQSAIVGFIQGGLGLAGVAAAGLLFGYVAGATLSVALLAFHLLRQVPRSGWSHDRDELARLAKEYRRFPQYSTWEALANSAGIQVPIIMIAALAVPAEAGYLMWAMYMVQAPMSLLGTAVGQVYLSHAPGHHVAGTLNEFTADVFEKLLKAGLGPLVAIGILSPVFFGFVFGAGWERAGALVAWMVPWFILQFLVSPVSMALHVVGRQRAAMTLQLYGLVVRVAAVWIASRMYSGAVSETYAVSGAVVYGTYLVVVSRTTGISAPRFGQLFVRALPLTGIWIGGATLLALSSRVLVGWFAS